MGPLMTEDLLVSLCWGLRIQVGFGVRKAPFSEVYSWVVYGVRGWLRTCSWVRGEDKEEED